MVGSANLTTAAIQRNQEVVVSIDSSDVRFNQLGALFGDYWDDAQVLTPGSLTAYRLLYDQFSKLENQVHLLEQQVLEKLGEHEPKSITKDLAKKSKKSVFLEGFQKTYQSCVSAFKFVHRAYEKHGVRKVPASEVPLDIEIDSFISFIRDKHAKGERWRETPLRFGEDQEMFIRGFIDEWIQTPRHHYEHEIVEDLYPRLRNVFASPDSIKAASDEDLFESLAAMHSFHDRLRFFKGGMPKWKVEFIAANDPKKIRETLSYLIFGKGPMEERMANVIFDPEYKPDLFGRANVQELVGWCSNEGLPIINSRTTKILRFFGSDVPQLQGVASADA